MKRKRKQNSKRSRKAAVWFLLFFILIGIEAVIAGVAEVALRRSASRQNSGRPLSD